MTSAIRRRVEHLRDAMIKPQTDPAKKWRKALLDLAKAYGDHGDEAAASRMSDAEVRADYAQLDVALDEVYRGNDHDDSN